MSDLARAFGVAVVYCWALAAALVVGGWPIVLVLRAMGVAP